MSRAARLAATCALVLAAPAGAQTPASTAASAPASANAQADTLRTPGGALRRALLLPGLGQVYNGQPLKAPVVAAALGGSVAYLVVQQRRTTLYRRAAFYAGCLDAPDRDVCRDADLDALLPAYVETEGERVGAGSLRTTRDNARGSRDLAAVGVAAVYALQALDAYVGAQLLGFDVSDDVAVRAEPGLGGARLALRVRL